MLKHTQKMILVPEEFSERTKPIDSVLNALDAEMQKILSIKNLPIDIKRIKYNEVLQRFNRLQDQRRKPYEIPIFEQVNTVSDEQILESMPPRQVNVAKLFLHHVRVNPSVQIEDSGEIVVDGHIIHGSNIVDLVHDFARERKTHAPATGARELAMVLKRANIPLESIGNKARLAYFLQQGHGKYRWTE